MKRAFYLLACLAGLASCTAPVTTSKRTETIEDNEVQISSGTWSKGHFVSVENTQKTWEGGLKGGKEKWGARRDFLYTTAKTEIQQICGDWFFAMHKAPVYNMLDNDETMGGMAPVLGVAASMVAYLAAEAKTQDANIPISVYIEFNCETDEK